MSLFGYEWRIHWQRPPARPIILLSSFVTYADAIHTQYPPVSCCCFSMRDFLLTLTSFINIELFLVLAHVVDGCHQAKKTLFIAISALMGLCVWLSIIGLTFHIYFFRLWYTRRIAFDCCWSFIWSQNSAFQIDDIITCCVLAFEAKGCTLDLWQTIGDGSV